MTLFSIFLIIQCVLAVEKQVYNVRPTKKTKNCPKPCLSLKTCMEQPNYCFKSDVELHFLPKLFLLSHGVLIKNVNNFSLLVTNNQSAVLSCNRKRGYLAFDQCKNITISNIVFKDCGTIQRSMTSFTALPVTYRKRLSTSLVLNNCTSVQLSSIMFHNSFGHGMILINPQKISIITNLTFVHSKPLYSEDIIFAGMMIYVNEFIRNKTNLQDNLIILKNSQFLNYNGFTNDYILEHLTATTLSVVITETVNRLKVNVHNTAFVNCTCFNGPLIEISLQYSSSSKVHIYNVTLLNNTQDNSIYQAIQLRQVFLGHRNLSNTPTGHMVTFDHCVVSNNINFPYILQLSLVGDKKSLPRLKEYKLPFKLFIIKSSFSHNKIGMSLWKVNFNINRGTELILPAIVTVNNSKFVSNNNSLMDIAYVAKVELSGYNIFCNNTANSNLLALTQSNTLFSGYNEFSYNTIFGSSLLKLIDLQCQASFRMSHLYLPTIFLLTIQLKVLFR